MDVSRGDNTGGLEAQKLQLERDKLAFEIRKFDADEVKRQNEAAKLAEKVRELRRPWYQKPAYIGPLATITVAVVGGFIAFGTDVFKSNVIALRGERDQLSKAVNDLGSAKARLAGQNASLSGENDRLRVAGGDLQKAVAELTGDATKLRNANLQLQTEKQRLSQEVAVAELRTHLKIIQSFGGAYNHLELGNQSLRSIFAIAEQFGQESAAFSALKSAYDSARSEEVQTALALALFKASRQPVWKERLRQSSTREVLAALASEQRRSELSPIFLDLLRDDSTFTLDERVATLREMYAAAKEEPNATASVLGRADGLTSLGLIVDWDEDATIRFRDPWFDYLHRLYDLREWEGGGAATAGIVTIGVPRLLGFAPQAFGILLIRSLKDSPTLVEREIPTGFLSTSEMECPFPADFPLCIGFLQATKLEPAASAPQRYTGESTLLSLELPGSSIFRLGPAYSVTRATAAASEKWMEENRDLVSVWTDLTFRDLRTSSDEVMRRIIRRGWVSIADVRSPRQQ